MKPATIARSVALVLFLVAGGSSPPCLEAQAATASGAGAERAASETAATVAAVTAGDFRQRIGILAHDSMRGRDTPSRGLELTARYVAEQFRALGLEGPVGPGGYQQRYPLTLVQPGRSEEQRVELSGPAGRLALGAGTFLAVPTGNRARAEGPLRGWVPSSDRIPEDGILLAAVTPNSIGPALGRVRTALRETAAPGAMVVVDAPEPYFLGLSRFFGSRQVSLGEPDLMDKPVVFLHRDALPGELVTPLLAGDPLPGGWSVELETRATVEAAEAMNTLGVLRGSDPALQDEYVVFTAHMDHVGVGRPVGGDSIYNGADDDASGTAAILELAERFASDPTPPRRSLVFMTVSGEEKGLLGSRWYSENPVLPLERTVANINIDMIGRNWQDTVVAIGKQQSSLGELVDRVASEHPELGLAVIDDRWPEENFYFRSDHFNFARKGVPILFFFSGVHEDYHRPSDEPEKIEYDKIARIAKMIHHLGRAVADADEPPSWDPEAYRQVVEEEARR